MRPVLSAENMRAWDESQIARGVPGLVLMENAGRGAAHLIGLKAKPRREGTPPRTGSAVAGTCVRCADERSLASVDVLILCGPGNNGGDGFVVARHLAARGANVSVWCLADPERYSGAARTALLAMNAAGIEALQLPDEETWASSFRSATIVVDALLGTGTTRPLEGRLRALVEVLNGSGAYVVALDVPTGLHASTGAELGTAVQAAHTVTFGHLKLGLLTTRGHQRSGTITVSHIGVPSDLGEVSPDAWLLEESDLRARLSPRSPVEHKGSAGRVVAVAGRPGTLGAARLCARAALRSGAGLVTIATHPEAAMRLDAEVFEVMTHPLSNASESRELLASADTLIVGPGLGYDEPAERFFELALDAARPTVVDADALRFLKGRSDLASGVLRRCVLTPHPGEAARLLSWTIEDVESDRFAAAHELAERYGAVVLLKGSRPIVARKGSLPVVSAFGSPALATGGSGDTLSGILAAQLVGAADPESVFERTLVAVGLQGLAAERWSDQHGQRGLLASEVGDLVPEVLSRLLA